MLYYIKLIKKEYNKNGGTKKVKIRTEFTADNLTIFGGYFNIFNFFVKSNIFKKFDRFISVKKRKKIYEKLDYIKILITMLIFGFKNMNQVSFLNNDKFVLKLLDLKKFPHASNIAKFLKRFRYKHCQQIIDVKKELFKKFHKKAFNLKRLTIDIDTTVLNIWGHQEGAEKGYNDIKRGNRCYHPILAFVYETKELLHGILKPGDSYCSNGGVEFIKELMAMIPYGIHHITFRADCGFFSQEILLFLENMKFEYIIAAKNYPTILNKVISIKDIAYKPFEGKSEIAFFHYRLKKWNIKRKFIVVRTPKEYVNPQLDIFGIEKYEYQILVTNINDDPKKLVHFYHKRGNTENYIKELKYDINIGKLNTDSFWANQAIFQFMILCYNMIVWFKNIFIGKSELKTTIRTFRERFLLISAKLIKRSRQFILKLPRDFIYKEKIKSIELQLA